MIFLCASIIHFEPHNSLHALGHKLTTRNQKLSHHAYRITVINIVNCNFCTHMKFCVVQPRASPWAAAAIYVCTISNTRCALRTYAKIFGYIFGKNINIAYLIILYNAIDWWLNIQMCVCAAQPLRGLEKRLLERNLADSNKICGVWFINNIFFWKIYA